MVKLYALLFIIAMYSAGLDDGVPECQLIGIKETTNQSIIITYYDFHIDSSESTEKQNFNVGNLTSFDFKPNTQGIFYPAQNEIVASYFYNNKPIFTEPIKKNSKENVINYPWYGECVDMKIKIIREELPFDKGKDKGKDKG